MREEILEYQNNMIEAKTIYLKHVKSCKLSGYILGHKYYKLRSFCFPLNELNRFNKKLDLSIAPIYDFLKNANIELYNEDANKIIDDNDNEQPPIFLDPPYIASCNNFYSTDTGENICNIYEKLYYYKLKNCKSKIIICHENNWLFSLYSLSLLSCWQNVTPFTLHAVLVYFQIILIRYQCIYRGTQEPVEIHT